MSEVENKRQEHISKFIGDLAKATFTVGLASYFFKDFPVFVRIRCGLFFVITMLVSFWLYPKN